MNQIAEVTNAPISQGPMPGGARHALVAAVDEITGVKAARAFKRVGCSIEVVDTGCAVRAALRTRPTRLLALDLGVTDVDAFDFLMEIRESTMTPVIAFGASGTDVECTVALDHGADDYVGKPFSQLVLAARADALLRRAEYRDPPRHVLSFGDLEIDVQAREARCEGEPLDLTAKEFALLAHLAANPHTAFSRGELLAIVWDSDPAYQSPATVTEHVRRLRRKIEAACRGGGRLTTVRGVGYRFDP